MNPVDNFFEVIRWGSPEYLCYGLEPLVMIREPGSKSFDNRSCDYWGVKWGIGKSDTSGRLCVVPGYDVITDLKSWKTQLRKPDIKDMRFDYAKAATEAAAIDRRENLVCLNCTGGIFERAHFLLGFENCLAQLLLEPEIISELMDVITAVKIDLLEETYKHTKFQAVFFHDDWGSKHSLFFSPEIWRALIKPRHQKIVNAVKSFGDGSVVFIHHSDTFLEPLVPEMACMGIDVWQGCIPQNDIAGLQRELRGKIAFMGGIDIAKIDKSNYCETEVRAETRRAVDDYAPLGGFIPGIPSGSALYPEVQRIINDELKTYAGEFSNKYMKLNESR